MDIFLNPIFIDSGAHGLYNEHVIQQQHKNSYDFYGTKKFWQYVDLYAEFIKKYQHRIELYANIDAIFNPEITWDVQMYLEKKHGLLPLPVIHHGTDLKWLKRYLKRGYPYIALGGLGQEVNQRQYVEWADRAFIVICDTPDKTPMVKVHGFAMTSFNLMVRYPWYSVDSATWIKVGGYGGVIMPIYQNNKWRYDIPFQIINTSSRSDAGIASFCNADKKLTALLAMYAESKGFKVGKSTIKEVPESYVLKENETWAGSVFKKSRKTKIEIIEERGIINDALLRIQLNGLYFLDLAKHLPTWPWSFTVKQDKLFEL